MDDKLFSESKMSRPTQWTHCDYCAAPLNPVYSFCVRCAKPYKPAHLVLPKESRPYEDDEVRIRKRAPQAIDLFLWFLAVIGVSGAFAGAVFGWENMFHVQVFVQLCLILTTLVFAATHFPALAVQLKVPGVFSSAFLLGLCLLPVLLAINYFYHVSIIEAFDSVKTRTESYHEIFPSFAGMVLFICVVPSVMEEIAFRGLIQHWLHAAVSPRTAIVVASAMFSAAHFSVISAPYLFLAGVLLGWLRWKTGSLYPSMIVHFLHNFAIITLMN